MYLFKSIAAQHDLIQETYTTPAHGGLKLVFSQFEGYSPMLEGGVHVNVVDAPGAEKSGDITVAVTAKSSNPSYQYNIRVLRQGNEISISTGGLSLLSYATAPRLTINVAISLPRSIGDLDIHSLSLPITVQAVEKANDVVLKTGSSPITVAGIDARSLTVSTKSGHITFEELSEQITEKFIKVSNSSGGTSLGSTLSSPSVEIGASSGSISLGVTTSASELTVKNNSGSISGDVGYSKGVTSDSTFEDGSGSLSIALKGWTGFLTADSSSGSNKVDGRGLERWNDGWKKGDGNSKAYFRTKSGAIKVEVL